MAGGWLTKVLSELAMAVGVAAFFWFLRKKFPISTIPADGPTLEELRPKYRKWEIAGGVVTPLVMVAAFFPWWMGLCWLTRWHAAWFEPAVFNLYAAPGVMAVASIFLAIATGVFVWLIFYRICLGDRFAEYMRYGSLAAGFDTQRGCLWLFSVMSLLSWGGFILALTWNVVFYEDRILFRSFLGLSSQSVPYAEVVELCTAPQVRAPNGNLVNRREYWLTLKDGGSWSTNTEISALTPEKKKELFEFLSRKAKKPIRQLAVLE